MQITNNPLPIPTPKSQAKAQDPAKALDAFNKRLQDIQENRDLRAVLAERNAQKGFSA